MVKLADLLSREKSVLGTYCQLFLRLFSTLLRGITSKALLLLSRSFSSFKNFTSIFRDLISVRRYCNLEPISLAKLSYCSCRTKGGKISSFCLFVGRLLLLLLLLSLLLFLLSSSTSISSFFLVVSLFSIVSFFSVISFFSIVSPEFITISSFLLFSLLGFVLLLFLFVLLLVLTPPPVNSSTAHSFNSCTLLLLLSS